jgi:hypothetical protein
MAADAKGLLSMIPAAKEWTSAAAEVEGFPGWNGAEWNFRLLLQEGSWDCCYSYFQSQQARLSTARCREEGTSSFHHFELSPT